MTSSIVLNKTYVPRPTIRKITVAEENLEQRRAMLRSEILFPVQMIQ